MAQFELQIKRYEHFVYTKYSNTNELEIIISHNGGSSTLSSREHEHSLHLMDKKWKKKNMDIQYGSYCAFLSVDSISSSSSTCQLCSIIYLVVFFCSESGNIIKSNTSNQRTSRSRMAIFNEFAFWWNILLIVVSSFLKLHFKDIYSLSTPSVYYTVQLPTTYRRVSFRR